MVQKRAINKNTQGKIKKGVLNAVQCGPKVSYYIE